jgi:phenylpropionate dioxygenase-like ring-hydroxylating dioxygenase large terminal subunit
MIYNQWYVILDSEEVSAKKPLKIKRLNQTLTVWRDNEGEVCCISDRCCHRGASLSCGKIIDGKLECPFHGFQFAGDGKVKLIPANGKNSVIPDSQHVHSFSTYEKYGLIWMWWGDNEKNN